MSDRQPFLVYTDVPQTVYNSGTFAMDPMCNGFVVTNEGSDVVIVNGKQLNPPPAANLSGESWGMSGNYGEVYGRRQLNITFNSNVNPRVTVIQKIYHV